MERLTGGGWEVYGPGETVKCPSTETVVRGDRRGGPLGARQLLRRNAPPAWAADAVPPDDERRRLRWPDGGPPSGAGPRQRECHRTIEENGPDSTTFVRPAPVDTDSGLPHYHYLDTLPAGCTTGYRLCQSCGIRLELIRIPTSLLVLTA